MTKALFLSVCEQDAYNFGGSVGPQMAEEGREKRGVCYPVKVRHNRHTLSAGTIRSYSISVRLRITRLLIVLGDSTPRREGGGTMEQ